MMKKTKFKWSELILGILLILLGIYTFANPSTALTSVVILYGLLSIITGIADIIIYVTLERRTGFGPALSLIAGILSILVGILILMNPAAGKWTLAVFFPIWFIAHCISRLANIGLTRIVTGTAYFYFSLVINVLGLILGFILFLNPWASVLTMSYTIGFYLLLIGIDSLVMTFSNTGRRL